MKKARKNNQLLGNKAIHRDRLRYNPDVVLSDRDFKIIVATILKDIVGKVDNMHDPE